MAVRKAELVAWIRAEIANAKGYDSDDLAQVRTEALARYRGEPRGDEQPGRSDVQSNDVADMVEAIVAQVLPAFSQDVVAEFESESTSDVEGAAAESEVVNRVIMEESHGYALLQEALRDALLLRNGWVRIDLDDQTRVSEREFDDISMDAALAILEEAESRGTVEVLEQGFPQNGPGRLKIRVTDERKRVRVKSVDPIDMSWNRDADCIDVQRLRFLSERWRPTRSELISMGYSRAVVERVPGYSGPIEPQDVARDPSQSQQTNIRDRATQRVRARWVHYRYDSDGDGIAELHRILYLEDAHADTDAILEDEVVEFVPYATGTPILQPHRLDGLGVWDKLKEIEKGKTAVIRQWLDNLKTSNQPGIVVNSNIADPQQFVLRRPGGVYGVEAPPGEAVMPMPITDIGQSCLSALEYLDRVRSERSGASLDLQAQQTRLAGDTAHGIERQISAKELMAAMMTRTLAETLIRQTYLLTHRALRSWMNQPVEVRVKGQAGAVNPATWPERDRVNVKTGLSVAERLHRRQVLEAVIAEQKTLWEAGESDVMVTRSGYHAALIDWTRAAQLDNGERYFVDPSSESSQQAQQQKAQQAEQAQQMQLQIAAQAANAEQQRQQIENAMTAWKAELDTQFNVWKESLHAELELLKMGDPAGSGEEVTQLQAAGA